MSNDAHDAPKTCAARLCFVAPACLIIISAAFWAIMTRVSGHARRAAVIEAAATALGGVALGRFAITQPDEPAPTIT